MDNSLCHGSPSIDFPAGSHQLQERPESERPCNVGECPTNRDGTSGQHRRRSVILSEPIVFTQLLPSRRTSLDVGVAATLIPGYVVNVHCPVAKSFSRQNIVWRRPNGETLTSRGRIKASTHGTMRIRKSRPADAGQYTCIAGKDSASVEIAFHSEDEAASMAEQRLITAFEDNNVSRAPI